MAHMPRPLIFGSCCTLKMRGHFRNPKGPNSPMQVIFTDFRAQCRYHLHIWIPRERRPGSMNWISEFLWPVRLLTSSLLCI